jgi:hypothetical protein
VALDKYGVFVSVPMTSLLERARPSLSLRVMVSAKLSDKEVTAVAAGLKAAAKEVLGG